MIEDRSDSNRLPLSALLSHAYVAFVIELDNEFEHRSPHRTTLDRGSPDREKGPWLTSAVMWANCMRFVDDEGITTDELVRLARTHTVLNGMQRWGYVKFAPDPTDPRPKPPESSWLITATSKGLKAKEVWLPLFGEIESRWTERFGAETIDQLKQSLAAIADQFEFDLPDCLPIIYNSLACRIPTPSRKEETDSQSQSLSLYALLSKVLLAFALEYERKSELSLAIGANVLRVLDGKGVRIRDIPKLSGVSKEAIAMAQTYLSKRGIFTLEPDSSGRGKLIRLTPVGLEAHASYWIRLAQLEQIWQERYGAEPVNALRVTLENILGANDEVGESKLRGGMEPYPDGWRARVPKPANLPHFPMVLHRGGYPDGS